MSMWRLSISVGQILVHGVLFMIILPATSRVMWHRTAVFCRMILREIFLL